jgi:hypothetical protein
LEIEWNGHEINGTYTIVMTDWSKNSDSVNSVNAPKLNTLITRDITPLPEFSNLMVALMSISAISVIFLKRKRITELND